MNPEFNRRTFCASLAAIAGLGRLAVGAVRAGSEAERRLTFHTVPLPVSSYRLLSMSMDDQGFIWTGSIHRVIHRYDPRNGRVTTIPLPFDASAASCIAVGPKVYILGQAYSRLIILDRPTGKFREVAYPSRKPDVWYGTGDIDGFLYLFDRSDVGVIRWDTRSDSGEVIPFPYKAPLPSGGQYDDRDGAIWCRSFELSSGRYVPVGIARLDPRTGRFTGWHPHPRDVSTLEPFTDPGSTLFLPLTLEGKILPFDFSRSRWCRPLDVPGYGERFGFIGGPWGHRGRWYYSLSTYNGTAVGCDGKPFHFCNAILEFNPGERRFEILTLDVPDAYYQISYMLSAGDEFFATGTNIREPDGRLVGDRKGEVVFWQTVRPRAT
jgi:hypothetical protein